MDKVLRLICFFLLVYNVSGQSGRIRSYSESTSEFEKPITSQTQDTAVAEENGEIIKINTDLVVVPVQVLDKKGRAIRDLRRHEFKIFENDIEQQIAYFSSEEQSFTVILMIDTSYSTIFKLPDIQSAALQFVTQLKPDDKVMVVSFDREVKVLCQPTTYRYATKIAIEATKNGSGTSLYDALGKILEDELPNISGRKAIVLLTDGVDTTSKNFSASDVLRLLEQTDSLVYVIQYDTYDDVQRSRNALAETTYGEDGKPIRVKGVPRKGEREDDYLLADRFLHDLASLSGGRKFRTSSNKVLSSAFFQIIEELRRVYILGYYPESARKRGSRYYIKVRVYRPNLVVRARKSYIQR